MHFHLKERVRRAKCNKLAGKRAVQRLAALYGEKLEAIGLDMGESKTTSGEVV